LDWADAIWMMMDDGVVRRRRATADVEEDRIVMMVAGSC
jgi:hypothetical protein